MSLTVTIIGNTNHSLMEFAIEKTIKCVPYNDIVIFCDKPLNISKPHRFYQIHNNFSLIDYSNFCIKQLNQYIHTDYCLTIQYDGFAANKNGWSDKFLEYDCIGPLISPKHDPMFSTLTKINTVESHNIIEKNEWRTGGGGFVLKSKKFLELCQKEDEITGFISMGPGNGSWICDDLELSYYHDKLFESNNIKFAPVGESLSFAAEITTGYNFSLGFHGWHNSALFLDEEEVIHYVQNLQRRKSPKEIGLFLGFLLSRDHKKAFNIFKDNNG